MISCNPDSGIYYVRNWIYYEVSFVDNRFHLWQLGTMLDKEILYLRMATPTMALLSRMWRWMMVTSTEDWCLKGAQQRCNQNFVFWRVRFAVLLVKWVLSVGRWMDVFGYRIRVDGVLHLSFFAWWIFISFIIHLHRSLICDKQVFKYQSCLEHDVRNIFDRTRIIPKEAC